MTKPTRIAVIGTGLIGRAWAIVFLRGGFEVALWDANPGAAEFARDFVTARLPELHAHNLLQGHAPETLLPRLSIAMTLDDAVAGAALVQESGPERVDDKRTLFARLDAAAAPDTILASSTSAIPGSAFTENLPGRGRCLVAHPVNPPYLVPVVELCPTPWTEPATVTRTRALMTQAGMVPATVNREIPGFLLNRLQAALLAEALALLKEGLATPEDIDATVKHGLGLRWSFMGPFETIDLNAPGGVADYCTRYEATMTSLLRTEPLRAWDQPLKDTLLEARTEILPRHELAARQEWRDRRLMGLLAHKAGQEE